MHSFSIRWFAHALLAALAAALLASCGGGGDDNNIAPAANGGSSNGATTLAASERVNSYAASLSGTQSGTANASEASGTILVNPDTRAFSATVTVSGIDGASVTIQPTASGSTNGATAANSTGSVPAIALSETSPGSGIWTARGTLNDIQFSALQTGTLAFNVGSPALPNGGIQGLILGQQAGAGNSTGTTAAGIPAGAASSTAFVSALRGSQETPPTSSTAQGSGALVVEPGSRTFIAAVATAGITGTDAHIHVGAPGVAGPVAIMLSQAGTGTGVWFARGTFTEDQLAALTQGQLYFDVHSAAFPAGEIRGQVLPVLQPAAGSNSVDNGTAGTSSGTTGGTSGTGTGATGTTGTSTGTGIPAGAGIGTGIGTTTTVPGATGIGTTTTGINTTGTGITGTGLTGANITGLGTTTGIGTTTGLTGTGLTGAGLIGIGTDIGTTGTTGIGTTGIGTTGTGIGTTGTGIGTGSITGVGTTGLTGSTTGGNIGTGTTGATIGSTTLPPIGTTTTTTGF
jgi:hypothetical protein